MSQPRTKEFYIAHSLLDRAFSQDTKFLTQKIRGYVRTFSTTDTNHQIDVGIYCTGSRWRSIELTSGLGIAWHKTLSGAFHFFQDDKIIERVWKSVNEDAKPGTTVYQAKATIAAIKD